MNLFNLVRPILLGIAAFAILPFAAAQRAQPNLPLVVKPPTQVALILETGGSKEFGGSILRVNAVTGAYLGRFAKDCLKDMKAIAVQPGTGIAYVADAYGITRFDVWTGQSLGYLVGTSALGGKVQKLRFNTSGALYAVVPINGNFYGVIRIDPATGAVLAQSLGVSVSDHFTPPTYAIGFRSNGMVEVTSYNQDNTSVHTFSADLKLDPNTFSTFLSGSYETFRTSNDRGLRWPLAWENQCIGSVGAFGKNDTVVGSFPMYCDVSFSEGANKQTFALYNATAIVRWRIATIDTSNTPTLTQDILVDRIFLLNVTDMAIYTRP